MQLGHLPEVTEPASGRIWLSGSKVSTAHRALLQSNKDKLILQEHTLAEGSIYCLLPLVLYTSPEQPSAGKLLQGTL